MRQLSPTFEHLQNFPSIQSPANRCSQKHHTPLGNNITSIYNHEGKSFISHKTGFLWDFTRLKVKLTPTAVLLYRTQLFYVIITCSIYHISCIILNVGTHRDVKTMRHLGLKDIRYMSQSEVIDTIKDIYSVVLEIHMVLSGEG